MKRVNIKISNKAVYSLLTIFIIAAVAVSVFAVVPVVAPNPGHLASEVAGVCRTDGAGCPDYQSDLGLHIRSSDGLLCYPTAEASSCTLLSEDCTQIQGTIVWETDICSLSASVQGLTCTEACQDLMACDGDATGFSCGTVGTVNYATGVLDDCLDSDELRCICSVSGTSYSKEVANSERCI